MSTISIHNLDSDIEQKIKGLAKEKNQSMNKTIKEILREKFSSTNQRPNNRKRFEKFSGLWSEEEAKQFQEATKDFETINPEDWK